MNKVIAFDSGEGSLRRNYIQALLRYYIVVKGIPTVALSSVDPHLTQAYLSLLPPKMRAMVYDLGSFHVYQRVTQHVNQILRALIHSRNNGDLIFRLFDFARTMQDMLIQELKAKGLRVILDRSRVSNYGYHACVYNPQGMIQKAMDGLRPDWIHIFIESPKRLASDLKTMKFYDIIAPDLNLKLKAWCRTLNQSLDHPIHLIQGQMGLEQGMNKIKDIAG